MTVEPWPRLERSATRAGSVTITVSLSAKTKSKAVSWQEVDGSAVTSAAAKPRSHSSGGRAVAVDCRKRIGFAGFSLGRGSVSGSEGRGVSLGLTGG